MAPVSVLLEMLSKCPLYLNHGPAIEIWSVVHLPSALISSRIPIKLSPSHGVKGCSNSKRSLPVFTETTMEEPFADGAWKPGSSTA